VPNHCIESTSPPNPVSWSPAQPSTITQADEGSSVQKTHTDKSEDHKGTQLHVLTFGGFELSEVMILDSLSINNRFPHSIFDHPMKTQMSGREVVEKASLFSDRPRAELARTTHKRKDLNRRSRVRYMNSKDETELYNEIVYV
jgi:hypothetical protein